ncbi:MAG: site-specific DNA-methyltransferase [Paludibacteraceae bacterium]|nr:site-specific DNA-methyltransferase [Paludibacteraceae bacterium]
MNNIQKVKADLIAEIEKRVSDRILEQTNADLLIKLINNADSLDEAINIAALGTTYKRTGLHFDKRLEKMSNTIKYFKKNETLSFHTDDDKPTHKLIIGDNYEALQNLLIQYRGKVNVIYIDPPYGKDSMGEFAATNYNNAITRDNLLSMLYPRLQLAKQLLSDDGVIFCSIDDKNQAYVKCLFDEVMGESNFIDNLHWKKKKQPSFLSKHTAKVMEHVLVFAKKWDLAKKLSLETLSDATKKVINLTNQESIRHFKSGVRVKLENSGIIKKGKYVIKTMSVEYLDDVEYENGYTINEVDVKAKFSVSQEKIDSFIDDKLLFITANLGLRRDVSTEEQNNEKAITDLLLDWGDNQDSEKEIQSVFGGKLFDYSKPTKLLYNLIKCSSDVDAIILDFFAGSGTTGHAVLDLNKQDGGNRSFILCQLNEKTETTPNGIAYDVTSKRIKRIMTGECYDGTKDFKWLEKNDPYGGNLDVYEIDKVSNFEWAEGKTPFDVIDETLYGKEKFATVREKIEWVCGNFDKTQKYLEKLNEEE